MKQITLAWSDFFLPVFIFKASIGVFGSDGIADVQDELIPLFALGVRHVVSRKCRMQRRE